MSDPSFFGYGSLVNLRTHGYTNPRTAQITGWRRIWHSIAGRDFATLSVTACATTSLSGIIADVPDADWTALDIREAHYRRQMLHCGTAIYEVQDNIITPPTPLPILRSYLDVVAQGYLDHFGTTGVADFFATTSNWRPVYDDRSSPIYPRFRPASADAVALVDHHLATQMQQLHQA
jgi:hypothetical protein